MEKEDVSEKRRNNLKEKNLHNTFLENTDFKDPQTCIRLRKGDLKKATDRAAENESCKLL